MNYSIDEVDGLISAKEQFILSLHTSAIFRGGIGEMSMNIVSFSLGPYPIDTDGIDFISASWSAEKIATQNLAIALDSCLEAKLGKDRLKEGNDIIVFIRCLRNAFSHNPYKPKWELTNSNYRRSFKIIKDWEVDLTNRHDTEVEEWDYRYASGLLLLVNIILDHLKPFQGNAPEPALPDR